MKLHGLPTAHAFPLGAAASDADPANVEAMTPVLVVLLVVLTMVLPVVLLVWLLVVLLVVPV